MAGNIREKQKKVREQGYKAAREDKLFPRELQNVEGDRWEDAKVYGKNTRQGQNYWQGHMKAMSQQQTGKSSGRRSSNREGSMTRRQIEKVFDERKKK